MLVRRLDAVGAGGVGLVVASAGSGKSVLLKQWAMTHPGPCVASLGLTARHDDAVVIAHDLIAAIGTSACPVDPTITRLVKSGGRALGEPFIAALLNELANCARELVLVLEDVHALASPELVADLGVVVTGLPENVRALVTTRRDLPWNLRPLRLAGRLVELRGGDLAFGVDEAQELLVGVSGRVLTGGHVATLVDRTDGWAAGLQLAAVSLQSAVDVSEFVEAFAGSDRLIADYLLEEVIERQTPEVRQFLLQTSVLDELTVEACDAVTGNANAAALLDDIERRSLFLIPLDASGQRFRYHHLVGDVLASQLRATDPAGARRLHLAAARWLLEQGRREEAIPHLMAGNDHHQAFELITSVGHLLFERGESATLVRWLTLIDAATPVVAAAVGVNLLAAHLAADHGPAAAETYRRLVRRADLTLGERAASDALYSLLVFRGLSPVVVLETVNRVRDALPELDDRDVVDFLGIGGLDSVHLMAEYAAAIAHFYLGDLRTSQAGLERVLHLPGIRYPVWRIYTLSSLALIQAWLGHSTAAQQLASATIEEAQALDVAAHPGVTHAHMAVALVAIDRLDLDSARKHLTDVDRQNRRRTSSCTYFDVQRNLDARLAMLAEGPERALELLRAPAASAQEPPVLVEANRALLVRLLIGTGDLAEARAVLADSGDDRELTSARIDLALAEHDLDRAQALLDAWRPAEDDLRAVIGRLLRQSVAADAAGERRLAGDARREALARADADQQRWPFVEVPAAVRAVEHGPSGTSRLVDDSLRRAVRRLDANATRHAHLVEALTARERAVLAYLPSRLRNQEIAAALYVSVNTLKSHLRSIYRKLDVADRDEAVAKATELGLL